MTWAVFLPTVSQDYLVVLMAIPLVHLVALRTHTLTTAELAAHTHGDGSYAVAGGSGGGSTGFLKTGGVAGSTAVTGSSGSAGSGTAHNNVQPTLYSELHHQGHKNHAHMHYSSQR